MKRFICILLCLMMVVPTAFSLGDDISISNLKVTLTIPNAGSKMDTPPVITLSESHCSVVSRLWVYEASDNFFEYTSDTIFKAGNTYMAKIQIEADDGYCFTDADLSSITSNVDVYWRSSDILGYSAYLVLKFSIPEDTPEEIVNLKVPKNVKLTAVSAKKIKVSWKKLSSSERKKAKYIEIQISTDKKFSKNVKTKKIGSDKASYTFSGLKKNTKYYVRIRAYNKSKTKINISKWVVKSSKTKK